MAVKDECKELRNVAARLRVTVEEMLAPASVSPSPQRLKLDMALDDVRRAVSAWDTAQALERMQALGQEMDGAKREAE